MAYISGNPKTKAEIKRAIANGKKLTCFQPGVGEVPFNGTVDVEGPHYPAAHAWYGEAVIKDGVVVRVK